MSIVVFFGLVVSSMGRPSAVFESGEGRLHWAREVVSIIDGCPSWEDLRKSNGQGRSTVLKFCRVVVDLSKYSTPVLKRAYVLRQSRWNPDSKENKLFRERFGLKGNGELEGISQRRSAAGDIAAMLLVRSLFDAPSGTGAV